MKKFQISYDLGNGNYHNTNFKGSRLAAKEYAQAYRVKKHLAPRQIVIFELR